jgi:hypothetical protein
MLFSIVGGLFFMRGRQRCEKDRACLRFGRLCLGVEWDILSLRLRKAYRQRGQKSDDKNRYAKNLKTSHNSPKPDKKIGNIYAMIYQAEKFGKNRHGEGTAWQEKSL